MCDQVILELHCKRLNKAMLWGLWAQAALATREKRAVMMLVRCEGGPVDAARLVFDKLRDLDVSTRADGDVSSAAILVFLAGKNRTCIPKARFGFHRVEPGPPPVLPDPRSPEDIERDRQCDEDWCIERVVERTGTPREVVARWYAHGDEPFIVDAHAALRFGIVDAIE